MRVTNCCHCGEVIPSLLDECCTCYDLRSGIAATTAPVLRSIIRSIGKPSEFVEEVLGLEISPQQKAALDRTPGEGPRVEKEPAFTAEDPWRYKGPEEAE